VIEVPNCLTRFIIYDDPADSITLVDTNITPFSFFMDLVIFICQQQLH
jgi:hypothetical protein